MKFLIKTHRRRKFLRFQQISINISIKSTKNQFYYSHYRRVYSHYQKLGINRHYQTKNPKFFNFDFLKIVILVRFWATLFSHFFKNFPKLLLVFSWYSLVSVTPTLDRQAFLRQPGQKVVRCKKFQRPTTRVVVLVLKVTDTHTQKHTAHVSC